MTRNDQSLNGAAVAAPAGWVDPVVAATPAPAVRRWGPLALWAGCLAAALVLLGWLGGAGLAVPAVTTPGAWVLWVTTGDPVTVTMTILRLLALGLAWYLAGVTSISVVARALRAARLVRVADALSFGPVRVVAQQAVGVGLAAGVVVTTIPAAPTAPGVVGGAAVDVAVMLPVEEPAAAAPAGLALREPPPAPVPAPAAASRAVSGGPVDAPTAAAATAPWQTEAAATTPSQTEGTSAGTAVAHGQRNGMREHLVAPGDHFWSIAEDAVARHRGRGGTDAEVRVYWEALVAANTDRLVVPGNPDLLLPGQQLLLPEVAA